MKNIITKLQGKRGVSIMLALLLMLICLLAGIAALTASSANSLRRSYAEDAQKQYLAVSSAARLIIEQLDGIELTGDYAYTANAWNDPNNFGDPDYNPSGDFSVIDPEFTNGIDPATFSRGDMSIPDIENDMVKFLAQALKDINYHEFYLKVKDDQNEVKWSEVIGSDTEDKLHDYTDALKPFEFTVECDEIVDKDDNPVSVKAEFTLDYTNKTLKLKVFLGDYAVSINGIIEITAGNPVDDVTYEIRMIEDPVGSGLEVGKSFTKVNGSAQTTTVKLSFEGHSFELEK